MDRSCGVVWGFLDLSKLEDFQLLKYRTTRRSGDSPLKLFPIMSWPPALVLCFLTIHVSFAGIGTQSTKYAVLARNSRQRTLPPQASQMAPTAGGADCAASGDGGHKWADSAGGTKPAKNKGDDREC